MAGAAPRGLEAGDWGRGYLGLLAQLTAVGEVSEAQFRGEEGGAYSPLPPPLPPPPRPPPPPPPPRAPAPAADASFPPGIPNRSASRPLRSL